MNLVEFIHNNLWGLIIAALSIAFQVGTRYAQLKNFVTKENLLEDYHTKEDVEKRIYSAFENHCPFSNLNERVETLERDQHTFHEEYQKTNNDVMMILQELKFNTKRICEKLEVKYLNNS